MSLPPPQAEVVGAEAAVAGGSRTGELKEERQQGGA